MDRYWAQQRENGLTDFQMHPYFQPGFESTPPASPLWAVTTI